LTLAAAGAVGIKEAIMRTSIPTLMGFTQCPWNKGRLIGQKRPLKPREVWGIRVRLQLEGRSRALALFNLAIGEIQTKREVPIFNTQTFC